MIEFLLFSKQVKPPRKKKIQKVLRTSGSVSFPVDFFESCTANNDIEFGGPDILQVYNVQQIKHRLHTSGLYIANTKPSGFTLDVTNNDSNQVIVGEWNISDSSSNYEILVIL